VTAVSGWKISVIPTISIVSKIIRADCSGILCLNIISVPTLVKNTSEKGKTSNTGDVTVLAWHDKERVILVSVYHTSEMHVSARPRIQ